MLLVVPMGASCASRQPLEKLELGVILTTEKEDHCFMLGSLGLAEAKSKEYLSGLGFKLAFSNELPPWPDWSFARIAGVYCDAGPKGAGDLIKLMGDPAKVANCATLDELIEKANCIMLVNTGAEGDNNLALVSKCLRADRPIFVDKFLAPKLSEARQMIKLAKSRGVPLASSSLLWKSQPALEMKAKLPRGRLEHVVSHGWASGERLAVDIHRIAHLQLLTENRRPVSVAVKKEGDQEQWVVTFDDGLEGVVAPMRKGAAGPVLIATVGGKDHEAILPGEAYRVSSAKMLGVFFDQVRGKGPGMPAHLMEDAVAIWEAARKAKETGRPVMIKDL